MANNRTWWRGGAVVFNSCFIVIVSLFTQLSASIVLSDIRIYFQMQKEQVVFTVFKLAPRQTNSVLGELSLKLYLLKQ